VSYAIVFTCLKSSDNSPATHTNLENHPRLIRARDIKPVPKIVLDRKTGLPSIMEKVNTGNRVSFAPDSEETEESDDQESRGGMDRVCYTSIC